MLLDPNDGLKGWDPASGVSGYSLCSAQTGGAKPFQWCCITQQDCLSTQGKAKR